MTTLNFDVSIKSELAKKYFAADEQHARIHHCFANCEITQNGTPVVNMVLDKYNPKNKDAAPGWYLGFRFPGYQERQTPALRVYMGSSLAVILDRYNLDSLFVTLWNYYKSDFTNAALDGTRVIKNFVSPESN